MRRFKDRIYLFSMSRYNCGRILACRTENDSSAVGQNFFDHLLIDNDQVSFFKSRVDQMKDRSVLLFSGGKERHAVIVVRPFCKDPSFLLGIELLMCADSVGYLVSNGIIPDVDILHPVGKNSADGNQSIREVFDYISKLISLISPLRSVGMNYEPMNEFDLATMAENLSELIGVKIKFHYSIAQKISNSGRVFSGSSSVLSIMIAAFVARRYSKHRQLNIEALLGYGEFAIRFVFAPDGRDEWKELFDSLDRVMLRSNDIYFNFREIRREKDGMILAVAELYPFFVDEGLVGVKKREVKLYDELPDFFILKE